MKFLKEQLKGMVPYHSAKIIDKTILNANESPFNLPESIKDLFLEELKNVDFNRYPDTDNQILIDAISKAYNIKSDMITCGVGSDEMIDSIFKGVISTSDKVLTIKPSFSMYKEFSKIHGANLIEVDLASDFSYDVENIIKEIKINNPKMVILCSPNNPTGSIISKLDIEAILKITEGLVLLDEAYVEFSLEDNLDLVYKYDNLIILRTFSKAYSLASMRCGYAISNNDNIMLIDTVKPPYNLNTLTQILAKIVIENKHLFTNNIDFLALERQRVFNELKRLNIEVYPSNANFLWVRLNERIFNGLLENDIYIRRLVYNDLDYYRITIGIEEENNKVIEVVKKYA